MSKISYSKKVRWLPRLILLGIIILWLINMIFAICYFPKSEDIGQFGDMFGVVNALFSGFAFAGVIYAILLQRQGLELQREELAATRVELEGQKKQLQAQDQTLQKQNFESSFFQLLRFHSEIVNSMQFINQEGQEAEEMYSGRESLSQILFRLKSISKVAYETANEIFYLEMLGDSDEGRQLLLERFNSKYEEFFTEYQSSIGYYFRNLYNGVKFVHEHDFPKKFEAKKAYINLIRAQLSSDELVLLFYNCLSNRGSKFKTLVEEYSLLEDTPLEEDIHKQLKELFYKKSAFGESD